MARPDHILITCEHGGNRIPARAPPPARRAILNRYSRPYRNRVEAHIAAAIAQGSRVIHLSSHSFTPVLDGEVRNADIGLLYDPARHGEAELCPRRQARL